MNPCLKNGVLLKRVDGQVFVCDLYVKDEETFLFRMNPKAIRSEEPDLSCIDVFSESKKDGNIIEATIPFHLVLISERTLNHLEKWSKEFMDKIYYPYRIKHDSVMNLLSANPKI